jgi:hypothetical protein
MRYRAAVARLKTIAERCGQVASLWRVDDPVLRAAYAFGDVLDQPRADLPVVQVAFVLDLPADELTWGVEPQSCCGLPHLLEVEKVPVEWYWRPAAWPVSNHVIRRPLRIWTTGGVDAAALAALAGGEAESHRLPAPDPDDEREQLTEELAASLHHLRGVESGYWERSWRGEHRGSGIYPEHHLWNAVHGYLDLFAAVNARET